MPVNEDVLLTLNIKRDDTALEEARVACVTVAMADLWSQHCHGCSFSKIFNGNLLVGKSLSEYIGEKP